MAATSGSHSMSPVSDSYYVVTLEESECEFVELGSRRFPMYDPIQVSHEKAESMEEGGGLSDSWTKKCSKLHEMLRYFSARSQIRCSMIIQ